MIDTKALRIGNWIHCKGSSHYGIVTGEILAKMEKDEKFREKFEYIELSGELLEAAGFTIDEEINSYKLREDGGYNFWNIGGCSIAEKDGRFFPQYHIDEDPFYSWVGYELKYLDRLQNFFFFHTDGSELPLPESAKFIPQEVSK